MGAAAGNDSCMANVIRMSMRYGNHATLEDGYGINLVPLATFAIEHYKDDPCTLFLPKGLDSEFSDKTRRLLAQMHKAIAIIQFKLEGQLILSRPDFDMNDRLLLDKIDYARGVLLLDGQEYPLRDKVFPTVDPANPYALTPEEEELVNRLHASFVNSEKLRKHMRASSPTAACISCATTTFSITPPYRSTKTARSRRLSSTARNTRASRCLTKSTR